MSKSPAQAPAPDASTPEEPLPARLQRLRISQGISLAELASETRIHLRYLEAIEQGHIHLLPEGLYMRNFIRAYLQALGIRHPSEVHHVIEKLTSGIEQHAMEVAQAGLPKPEPGLPAWLIPAILLVLLALGLGGMRLWQERQAQAAPQHSPTPTPQPTATPTPPPTASPSPTRTETPTRTSTPRPRRRNTPTLTPRISP